MRKLNVENAGTDLPEDGRDEGGEEGAGVDAEVEEAEECLQLPRLLRHLELITCNEINVSQFFFNGSEPIKSGFTLIEMPTFAVTIKLWYNADAELLFTIK